MRNTMSTIAKHQNSHPMLQLFGKLCDKYLPGENNGVLTQIIDNNVFQRDSCAYIGKKHCVNCCQHKHLRVNAIQVYTM